MQSSALTTGCLNESLPPSLACFSLKHTPRTKISLMRLYLQTLPACLLKIIVPFFLLLRHNIPRPEAGQRAARPRGPHQADRLRHVQGGHSPRRHHLHLLRHAKLHRPGDPPRRGLRILCRLESSSITILLAMPPQF